MSHEQKALCLPHGGAEEDHDSSVVHGVLVHVERERSDTLLHQNTKVIA